MYENQFSFFRTIVSDAFSVRCMHLTFPYEDINQVDNGFRSLVWGNYTIDDDIKKNGVASNEYKFTLVRSSLGFYNLVANVTLGDKPEFFSVGPYTDIKYNELKIREIISKQNLPQPHMNAIHSFYATLPFVEPQNILLLVQHLLEYINPEMKNAPVEYLNYSESEHRFLPKDDHLLSFSIHKAEEFRDIALQFLDAITSADINKANSRLQSILSSVDASPSRSLFSIKEEFYRINHFMAMHLMDTSVHPYYIMKQMNAFSDELAKANTLSALQALAFQMVHKYCLLVKNYSFPEYSFLIRNVVNYIDQHLDENLTLTSIAERMNRNASYLSAQFTKEVGCSITEYTHKQRIRESLKYITTTDMSITEVANIVGFSDFGYFTRVFKKQIGSTPSEYRKMMQKSKKNNKASRK